MVDFIIIVIGVPLLWQLPRLVWPVRLDSTGTHFTGLYGRYSVQTATGYASEIRSWTGEEMTTGSVSAHTTGTVIGNSVMASTTVNDNRRTFVIRHTGFFLEDREGGVHEVDAANVSPSLANGHLVSAAWLVHNGKRGNAFLVANHTTGNFYVESTRRGNKNVKRGLVKMVFPLPLALQVLLFIVIVTIPVMIVIGVGTMVQLRLFKSRGSRPLLDLLGRNAAEMPSRSRPAVGNGTTAAATGASNDDFASQMKQIAALHASGSLTPDEFQAAKAKLLEKT
jgi:hypothetical protein